MRGSVLSLCSLVLAGAVGAMPACAAAAEPNAFEIWTRPLEHPVGYPANELAQLTIAGEDEEAIRSALLAAQGSRQEIDRVGVLLREGLEAKRCSVGASGRPADVLLRGGLALGAVVLDAHAGKSSTQLLEEVLRVGGGLARCEGTFLSFVIGVALFKQAQSLARWLLEAGSLSAADARRLSGIMRREQPEAKLLRGALLADGEYSIRHYLKALGELDQRVLSFEKTARRLRAELAALASLALANEPGWVEIWKARRGAILGPEDRRFVEALEGPARSGDRAALEKVFSELGTPPDNVLGREFLRIVLPPGAPVADAVERISALEQQTREFEERARLADERRGR